jgi:ubiquinone biosynthesis protein COQ4
MRLRDAGTFARILVRTLRDSDRTGDLLTGEEITSVGRMEALVPMLEASAEGRRLLATRPRLTSREVDFSGLRGLPEGTLGRCYVEHLDRCGLDPDALAVPVTRGASERANYLLERVRQTHDVWHALVGLGTAGHEEVILHAFQWPQLRMPYSALVVGFGAVKHLAGEGRWHLLRHALGDAARAGRAAAPLLPVLWEQRWEQPIAALREALGVRPAASWPAFAA